MRVRLMTENNAVAHSNAAAEVIKKDLATLTELGDVRVARGDLAGALRAYEDARRIAEELAGLDPDNAERQRDLSVSWSKLADVRAAQGDLAGALEAYEVARRTAERLAGADPGDAGW